MTKASFLYFRHNEASIKAALIPFKTDVYSFMKVISIADYRGKNVIMKTI